MRITNLKDNIEQIEKILKVNRDPDVVGEAMFFLGETGEEKAVDIIFNLVEIYSEEEFKNVENSIKRGLFSSEWQLYKKYHKKINKKIYAMVEKPNSLLKKKGKILLKMKRNIALLHY